MIKNYLKVAFRNLLKNKAFSTINIAGLALGIACSMLILLWVQDERNVDSFHKKADRLFYIYERNHIGGTLETWYWTQGPLADELKKELPEVEAATAISWKNTNTFSFGDKILKEDGYAAGNDFFTMFSHKLVEGSAKNALNSPDAIAISRKMANAFFGSPALAIGKAIRFENRKNFLVKAVFEDMSAHVGDRTEFILSWKAYLEDNQWALDWVSVDPRTVILLRPGASQAIVEKKLDHFLEKFNTEQKNIKIELALQPFAGYYLRSEFHNGYPSTGRIEYVRLFIPVAFFILLIACINFMNLTTARSVKRAKEIGVRKVMGAVRGILIRQFLGEAVLMATLAAILALVIMWVALPAFNQLTGKEIGLPYGLLTFWLIMGSITMLTGIISGSYPALYLSSFNPIRVLKAAIPSGTRGDAIFRKSLVVFQFVLSIVLILSTFLISRQVNFLKDAKLGYDRENLIYIPIEGALGSKLDVIRTEVSKMPGIQGMTAITGNPTFMNDGTLSMGWTGKDPNEHERFIWEAVDNDYFKTMKIQLLSGRNFYADFQEDSLSCIINQTAASLTGYKEPIGQPLYLGNRKLQIVGVVKDFHFQSLHEKILPLMLHPGKNIWYSTILFRAKSGQTNTAITGLERMVKNLNPAFPFTYKFSDTEYTALYKSEEITGRLSVIFAILAIFISCLGLMGLSIFTAEQRMREIGIRKVLGASVGTLFSLLSKDFMTLVGISFLISIPLSWWSMHKWLQQFAYHTNIPLWTFLMAGIMAAIIALATVSIQTIRATRTNPIKSLRSE